MKVPEFAARGLDDADLVRPRVVPVEFPSTSDRSQFRCVHRKKIG